ncbi:MAG: BadM/Rrf2 family transcriptional regulator [Sneathiella sp.]|nr:MAG: BadM/Rrf2 family transcriptional regulator [Sneathiella sp.]
MRLNIQTDYALRILMHLAVSPERLVTIAEISARFDISKNHLMKVAHGLGHLGYIDTVRGRSGGLRLARAAKAIAVGQVVRDMEADFAIVECFRGWENNCRISGACRLNAILATGIDAFLGILDQYTLQTLVETNPALISVLNPEVAA